MHASLVNVNSEIEIIYKKAHIQILEFKITKTEMTHSLEGLNNTSELSEIISKVEDCSNEFKLRNSKKKRMKKKNSL